MQQGCKEDPGSPLVCFSFEACFKLNSTFNRELRLNYTIEAETFTGKKYFRVKFGSAANEDQPNIVQKDMVLNGNVQREFCSREVVYVKDKSDIQTAVSGARGVICVTY